jgi:hypothetical protein
MCIVYSRSSRIYYCEYIQLFITITNLSLLTYSSIATATSEAADIAEVELFFPTDSLSFLGGGGRESSPKSRVTA